MSIPVMQAGKFCANCVYWGGERTLEGFFKRVSIKDTSVKGVCSCMKGYYNLMTHWMSTCNAFERHPLVK
jgi:hypothetical protein